MLFDIFGSWCRLITVYGSATQHQLKRRRRLPTRKWNTRANTKVALFHLKPNFFFATLAWFPSPPLSELRAQASWIVCSLCCRQIHRCFVWLSLGGFTPASNRSPTAGSQGFRKPFLLLSRILSQPGLATYRQSDFFLNQACNWQHRKLSDGHEKLQYWGNETNEVLDVWWGGWVED